MALPLLILQLLFIINALIMLDLLAFKYIAYLLILLTNKVSFNKILFLLYLNLSFAYHFSMSFKRKQMKILFIPANSTVFNFMKFILEFVIYPLSLIIYIFLGQMILLFLVIYYFHFNNNIVNWFYILCIGFFLTMIISGLVYILVSVIISIVMIPFQIFLARYEE